MTTEEQIKLSWETAFKNLVECIDIERTKEEIACMFFELGWKAGIENENKSIESAINVLKNLKTK